MALLRRALECSRACLHFKTAYNLFLPDKRRVVVDHGLSILFHYLDPRVYTHHPPLAKHDSNDPLLPPFPPHVEVAHLGHGANHYVFVNRGMVVPGHVVVSHASPRAIQGEDLDICDCHAMAQVIKGYDGQGVAYYNAGVESGCSQMHKHMQFCPIRINPLFDTMKRGVRLPWRYYTERLGDITADELMRVYRGLKRAMNFSGSHNVIVCDGTMALVPRRQAAHPWGVNLNSLGVSGHFFVWETSDKVIEQRPVQVLKELCVPW
jgi:ATP adenylyltransferase/5',5'''-P-1,P-4-tetraphosphate phosphorylase II